MEVRPVTLDDPAGRHRTSAPPVVSVVIPTFNGLGVLRPCLESLRGAGGDVEVVLIDNASGDGTAAHVAEHFPWVRLLRLRENLGFAGATNVGIARARGRYLFFLNNDTTVEPGALDELVAFMDDHPEVALAGPKVVAFDEPQTVDCVGLAPYPDGTTCRLGRGDPSSRHTEPREVFAPSGCACLCRREALEQVGPFDEDFRLLLEDADLGWRVRLAGWSCYCVPSAVVRHRYSTTIGAYSAAKAYYVERNRIWMAVKNFPLEVLAWSPYYSATRYVQQAVSVTRGEGAAARFYDGSGALVLAATVLRAYAAAAVGLPAMLAKRRAIQKSRTVGAGVVWGWFDRFGVNARDLARIA